MPTVRKTSLARAIFCADIHLSHKSPLLRSDEPDWYAAMARPLKELRTLHKKLGVPVVCAGDVFDHWNVPPELINFALQELPEMYAIPGQHDLPSHSYEDIERSAYWTLVESGLVHHIEPGSITRVGDLELYGFPWGFKVEPCLSNSEYVKIAVIHEYMWIGKYKYQTAPESNHLSQFKLKGYDAVVVGDNHEGFTKGKVCNCGGLMRRHSPDLNRQPFIGVLMQDGTIKRHIIDTSDDIYSASDEDSISETGSLDLAEFTEGLLGLHDASDLDFGKVVQRYCRKHNIPTPVLSLIQESLKAEQ